MDFVANCTMLYPRCAPTERAAAAASDGYRLLETWWPFDTSIPSDAAVDEFVDSVHNSGSRLVALNFTLGDADSGGRGILSHPHRRSEFAEHCEVVAGIVRRLGVRFCNVPFGVRLPESIDRPDQVAVENLLIASDFLSPLGAMPMVEAVSGVPGYPLTTAAQAVCLIEQVHSAAGRPGVVGLLADLYHFAANGEDIDAVLRRYIDFVVHVQIADFPGRHEPGSGRLELDRYQKLLRDLGYSGHIALEYIPLKESDAKS